MTHMIKPANVQDVWLKERGRYRRGRTAEGKLSVSISCPRCGGVASLSGHAIDAQGDVTPSVVCPHDIEQVELRPLGEVTVKCDFHEFVRLEGWTEGAGPT